MNKMPLAALALATTLVTLPLAHAQVYQWKDAKGQTVVSDTPPPGHIKVQRAPGSGAVNRGGEAPVAAPTPAPAAKTMAERDMDFRKRQLEDKEKAEKEAKEQAAKQTKQENCERAKRALAVLESGQRITTTDSKGERAFLDDDARQQETERARKSVSDHCQ